MIFTILITALFVVPLILILLRQIRRMRGSQRWVKWGWMSVATVITAGLGYVVNQMELTVSNQMRIVGMPTPMVFFHLEDGHWVDFIVPYPLFNLAANIFIFGLAGAVVLSVVVGRREAKRD